MKIKYTFKPNFTPKTHQLDAVNFALSQLDNRSLISCATGTGKSFIKILLGIFLIEKLKRIDKYIIVAPPKGKISINSDFLKFTNVIPFSITDLESFLEFFNQNDCNIALMTYEMKSKLSYKDNRNNICLYPEVKDIISKYRIGYSFDEIHKVKNPSSIIYKCFSLLTSSAICVHGFTGTIMMTSLLDIYNIVSFINPAILISYISFCRNYIIFREIKIGLKSVQVPARFKNLDRLKEQLQPILFSYFPKIDIEFEEYKCDITPETKQKYIQIAMGVLNNDGDDNIEEDEYGFYVDNNDNLDILTHSSRLVHLQYTVDQDTNKLNLLLSVIKKCLHEGAVVYAPYHYTLSLIRTLFNDNKILFKEIHGKMSEKKVIQSLDWFTQDCVNKILLISNAGSASLNLQKTRNMVMYNTCHSFGGYIQLLGRICRIGSDYNKFIIKNIVAQNTIDSYKANYVTSNSEVVVSLFGTNVQLPKTEASGSFNSYFLQELRKKFLWDAQTTLNATRKSDIHPDNINNKSKQPKKKRIKQIEYVDDQGNLVKGKQPVLTDTNQQQLSIIPNITLDQQQLALDNKSINFWKPNKK